MAPAPDRITTPAALRGPVGPAPPSEALQICARDLAVAADELAVLSHTAGGSHYKSDIFSVGRPGSRTPLYVVKVDRNAYDAAHEAQALEFAARTLGQTAERSRDGLGVVRPVGWGSDPPFLVTRYQPGELAQRAFDRAVMRPWDGRARTAAHAHARQIARWLGVFRARAAQPEGGLEPAAFLDEVRHRALACAGSPFVAADAMRRLVAHTEQQLRQLGDADLARMRRRYPNRGDARPKNFLVGDDGVLYALDMEGFGFGPMEHDLACLHHAMEYDGVRSAAAARRASLLWQTFWAEYMQHGSSPAFALLGYVYFLLDRMRRSAALAERAKLARRLRTRIWLRNRVGWLARLTGDLRIDIAHMERNV